MVQHVKDQSDGSIGSGNWAFNPSSGQEREIRPSFDFEAKELKPLVQTLKACLVALGAVNSAQNTFVSIKSRNISPDGQLGGKGYVMKIAEIRQRLMNCTEALSGITDTLYDEFRAPHWRSRLVESPDKEEVGVIEEEVKELREDPEGWVEDQSLFTEAEGEELPDYDSDEDTDEVAQSEPAFNLSEPSRTGPSLAYPDEGMAKMARTKENHLRSVIRDVNRRIS
jgi:hypothetical protein